MSAPVDTVAPRMPSAPRHPLPADACDSHAHVFGPYERFALAHPSSYAPPLAPRTLHREMLDRVGAARGVLVQPAPYGQDPMAKPGGRRGRTFAASSLVPQCACQHCCRNSQTPPLQSRAGSGVSEVGSANMTLPALWLRVLAWQDGAVRHGGTLPRCRI